MGVGADVVVCVCVCVCPWRSGISVCMWRCGRYQVSVFLCGGVAFESARVGV